MFKYFDQSLSANRVHGGFSLIEVLVVIAVLGLVFTGLFASFEFSLRLIAQSRSKMSALSLATDRMEYIRSLPYDQVGTVLGIPSGLIPQHRTVSLNGYHFLERVLIEYVDDPADGLGVLDDNGVITDYKRVKVEYEWSTNNSTSTFALVSTVVPRGIETDVGGGSVRVNVFDAQVSPLVGIAVRLLNLTAVPPVDVTRFTNPAGIALFTGAPAAADYELFVSALNFSSDQTRVPSPELPNPNTLPFAVLESDVTTLNFQIDRVSELTLRFLSARNQADVTIDFSDPSVVAEANQVAVAGDLQLTEVGGVYDPVGEAWLAPLSPTPLISWGWFDFTASLPADTAVVVQFYTSTSALDIIPNSDLPGNGAGFTAHSIDLRGLSVVTYPTLMARFGFSTADPAVTPIVSQVDWSYIATETLAEGVDFTLVGTKLIGTLADLSPVPKFSTSSESGLGTVVFSDMEWDLYRLNIGSGLVIREACAAHPISLFPNDDQTVDLLLGPTSAHNLRVTARTVGGVSITGALVELERPGFSTSSTTGWCGQAYFGGLLSADEYEIRVGASGYATSTVTDYSLSGTNEVIVTLYP